MKRGIWTFLLIAAMSTLLSACGSSGGGTTTSSTVTSTSTTISGTAAAGAAIIGTVYIKDSKGVEKSVAIPASSNGKFSIDVSGMTGPFLMKAVGTVGNTQVNYCSAATTDDLGKNVNITPFTDLMVASLAGQVAANYYSNGNPALITTAALTAQVQALTNKLAPVMTAMGLSASTDLLRASFTPGASALDSMMDVVKVSVDPTTTAVTITNIIDNSKMTATSLTAMNSGSMMGGMTGTLTAPTTTQLTDIQQINAGIQSFVKAFQGATMPSVTTLQNLNLLGSTFMDEGRNLSNFLNQMTSKSDPLGMSAGPATFVSTTQDSSGNLTGAVVDFTVTLPKLNNQTQTIRWRFAKTNGVWQALGDGRIIKFDFHSTAYYAQSVSNTTTPYGTGLEFYMSDDYNSSGVTSAVVTGPGLPSPVTLYNVQSSTSTSSRNFTLDQTGANSNDVVWLSQAASTTTDQGIMSAFSGANDSNIPYTVTLYKGTTQLAQYTITITKRPFTYAELATAPFATFTNPATYTAMQQFSLTTANTITWTLASGTVSDWLNVGINGTDSATGATSSYQFNQQLLPGDTQFSGTISSGWSLPSTFKATSGYVVLSVDDQYGRILNTQVGAF